MRRKVALSGLCILGSATMGAAANAACTVPNTLTNGQVADATQVMDNFNAVADCSVSTSGSPTPGSLTIFTGTKSIGTGNLTGDVTTSGNTATTLSPTGVTAGVYSNPTIVVDAKGRITSATNGSAGAGASGIAFEKPVALAFSQVNFADASVSDGTYAMSFIVNGMGNSDNWALLTQPQTGTFTKVLHFYNNYPARKNFGGGGIILRESSTGKFISLNVQYNSWGGGNLVRVDHWNATNSLAGNVLLQVTDTMIRWLRVDVNATDRIYSYSFDGLGWVELYRHPVGTFITSDQVGLGAYARNENGTQNDVKLSIWHWGPAPQ